MQQLACNHFHYDYIIYHEDEDTSVCDMQMYNCSPYKANFKIPSCSFIREGTKPTYMHDPVKILSFIPLF